MRHQRRGVLMVSADAGLWMERSCDPFFESLGSSGSEFVVVVAAVFTIKTEILIVLKFKQQKYQEKKQNELFF